MTVNKDKKTGTWYYHFKITIDGNTQWHKKRGFLTKHECLLAEEEFKLSLQDPIQYWFLQLSSLLLHIPP